jgi:hypothetical protein
LVDQRSNLGEKRLARIFLLLAHFDGVDMTAWFQTLVMRRWQEPIRIRRSLVAFHASQKS